MLHHTRGIVLRTTDYSDSSIIAKVYTEQLGMQTYVINGVRSARSKGKSSLYQHGNLLDMVVYHRDTGDIFRISESSIGYLFRNVPFDIVRSSLLLFCVELIMRSVHEEDANPELFDFIWEQLKILDDANCPTAHFHLQFMIGLSVHLGFAPSIGDGRIFDLMDGVFCAGIPKHTHYMEEELSEKLKVLLQGSPTRQYAINHQQRKALLHYLITFYQLHIPQFGAMKSPEILEAVFREL